MKHIIGFPGLFEDRYVIDRVAFDLGKLLGMEKSVPIYWYGIIIVSAMILAYIYFMIRAKRSEGIVEDDTTNIMLLALPIGIVGARTFYVLTNLSHFESFKEAVFGIRDGGLAIYGGIVFGLITILVYCFIKKISTLKTLDAIVPAVMIAQAIGRWGNFFNAEAYGRTDGVENFFLRMSIANFETPNVIQYVHPTFLYESLWNISGFVVANLIYRKKKFDGQIFAFYLFWYGVGRGFIELLRTDSCMILSKVVDNDPLDVFGTAGAELNKPGLKAFVYLSIILVITSVVLYVLFSKKQAKEMNDLSELQKALADGEEDNASKEDAVNESITAKNENVDGGAESNTSENADYATADTVGNETAEVNKATIDETDENIKSDTTADDSITAEAGNEAAIEANENTGTDDKVQE